MKKIIISLLLLVSIILLTACGDDNEVVDVDGDYIITFNTSGGSSISDVGVNEGETVNEPTVPTKEGYVATEWYTDSEFTDEYNFSDIVTEDFTLYMKWDEVTGSTGDGPGLVTVLDELPDETTTIVFWHGYQSDNQDLLNRFIDEFELLYPNIVIQATIQGYIGEIPGDALTAYSAGLAPTMILGDTDHLAKISNILVPLDDFVYDNNFGTDIDDYVSSFIDENRQYEDGYMRSFPHYRFTDILIINKDMFEANGLEVKTDEPYSWAELDTISTTLVGTGSNQCDYLINYDFPSTLFINSINQWNGGYTNFNGEILVDNTNTKLMMDYLRVRFENKTFAVPMVWDELYGSTNFKAQDVCMTTSSIGTIPYIIPSNNEFEIAIGMLPQYDVSNPVYPINGVEMAIIDSATDAERLAAWLFMSYITNTENAAEWALLGNTIPIRHSSFDTSSYQEFLNNPSSEDLLYSQALNHAYSQLDYYQFEPAFYDGTTGFSSLTVRDEAKNAVLLLLYGNYTTDEIIAAMIAELIGD